MERNIQNQIAVIQLAQSQHSGWLGGQYEERKLLQLYRTTLLRVKNQTFVQIRRATTPLQAL